MNKLRERLAEQQGRHQGGNKWVGTGGTSPFGNSGYNPEGVRIGGESRHKRAIKVWDKREFKNLDNTRELGTRNIKVALRRLRRFAREGSADELDIDATINPRATTVSSILRHIRHGRVRAVYAIGDSEAEMIEAQVLSTSPLAGQLIRDVDFPDGVLVGGLMRLGRMVKLAPDTRLQDGDVVALFALTADVPELEKLLQVSIDFF